MKATTEIKPLELLKPEKTAGLFNDLA